MDARRVSVSEGLTLVVRVKDQERNRVPVKLNAVPVAEQDFKQLGKDRL